MSNIVSNAASPLGRRCLVSTSLLSKSLLSATTILVGASGLGLSPVARAADLQPAQTVNPSDRLSSTSAIAQVLPRSKQRRPRPPRRLPPNRVQPGGGLDDLAQACDPNSLPLTALVPESNPVYTASAHPTFLFYLPDSPETVNYAEFILLSADEKEQLYAERFSPTRSGIVTVAIPPKSVAALDVGQPYHWYLNLHCQTTADVPSVNGWVQRLEVDDAPVLSSAPTASTALTEAPTLVNESARSELPAVWYDAIAQTASAIASSRSPNSQLQISQSQISQSQISPSQSSQAQTDWQRWLAAIGLDALVNVPFVESIPLDPMSAADGDIR